MPSLDMNIYSNVNVAIKFQNSIQYEFRNILNKCAESFRWKFPNKIRRVNTHAATRQLCFFTALDTKPGI